MTPKELVDTALREGLLSDKFIGRTPWRTMNSKLSVHIRRMGDQSIFIRRGPGLFDIRRRLFEDDAYVAQPRTPPAAAESVLVFPSNWLDQRGRFQGITRSCHEILTDLLSSPACHYKERLQAEQDESIKQIVTYVMITRGEQVLCYRRGTYNRTENFLRGCQCIGFGGHVTLPDFNLLDAQHRGVFYCAGREINEELKLPHSDVERIRSGEGVRIIGLLNDDSSPAGRRHFGVVLQYEVGDSPHWDEIRPRELSIAQLRWIRPGSSDVSVWDFEYWSQLCLREYFRESLRVHPSYRIQRRVPFRPPHVLCVVGSLGSGKSAATAILRDEFGYTEVNSGRIMASLLNLSPVTEPTRATFQQDAWEFISSPSGPRELAAVIWKNVDASQSSRVLVDGIRQLATLDELRRTAGSRQLAVLYIHTPPDIAYAFYGSRAGADLTIHDFLRLRDAPVERDVPAMLGVADAVLYNWTGELPYRDAIRNLMNETQSKRGGTDS